MSNANREYKTQGVMIDGARTDISYHRTEAGARRAQRKLDAAYSRRLQIRTEVRRLNDDGTKYLLIDED